MHLGCCVLQDTYSAATSRRALQQRVNDPLVLTFASAEGITSSADSSAAVQKLPGDLKMSWSAMKGGQSLPPNVHLLTLKDLGDAQVMIRLAHLFQVRLV